MSKTSRTFEHWLLEKLKKPETAAEYLLEHLTDDGEGDYLVLLRLCLVSIGKAYGVALK